MFRRVFLLILMAVLAFEGISYGRFITQASSTGFGVRSVEWVRANVSSWLVDEIERGWYSWNAPDQGGPALTALPQAGAGGGTPLNGLDAAEAPSTVRPLIRPALAGEGVWRATGPAVSGAPPVLVTTFRSDPSYPRMVAGVAWIDQRRANVTLFPGRYEPPGFGPRGPMQVPVKSRDALLATFNSGFRLEDGKGGFYANGHLWTPLIPKMGTIVGLSSGRVDIRTWTGGARPGPGIMFARQNLPLIVINGHANPNLSDGPEWGATLGNAIRVWRSGLGIDRHGNLIYAAADQQTVESLARILVHAGAVRAMELDINYEWVSFISYGSRGGNAPSKLLSGIDHGGTRFLVPDDRDFFAVTARASASSPPGAG